MRYSSLLRSSLLLASFVAPSFAADDEEVPAGPSDVTVLTGETFEDFSSAAGLKLIEFYAPWCGHCKALAPHYEESATALKEKNIKLAKVDCVDQAELCSSHGIQGYPTLKVYKDGKESDYNGPRKADGIVSYMIKQSLPAVSDFTSANYDEIKGADKIVVLAFVSSSDDAAAKAFSAAAETHRDDYLFGLTTDEAAIKAAGVTAPAIVLYKTFDEGRNDMSAEAVSAATAGSITSFIKENSIPLMDEVSGENYGIYSAAGLPLVYLFIDPKDTAAKDALIKEISPIAKQHRGAINFVWIDAVKFVEHAKNLGLKEGQWPALVMQELKTQHKYPLDQSAEVNFKNVDKLIGDYVAGNLKPTLKSAPIPEEQTEKYFTVVGKTFDETVFQEDKDVFIQFSAPWCGHCKRLLPTYETLAEGFRGNAESLLIAKMDATENDLPMSVDFTISGFPTLKFKKAGTKEFIDYEGDRTLENMVEFVEKHSSKPVKFVAPKVEEPKVEETVVAEQAEEAQVPVVEVDTEAEEKKADAHDEL